MPKAWSEELRMKAVKAVEEQGLTITAAARIFDVGTASLKRWLAKFRATGDVRADSMGGLRMVWIGVDEKPRLLALVKRMPDATVEELALNYNERYRTSVSRSAMGRALRRFALTRKKSPSEARRR